MLEPDVTIKYYELLARKHIILVNKIPIKLKDKRYYAFTSRKTGRVYYAFVDFEHFVEILSAYSDKWYQFTGGRVFSYKSSPFLHLTHIGCVKEISEQDFQKWLRYDPF